MAFVPNPQESLMENIHNHVGYILQTIENHNPPMDRVKGDLQRMLQALRDGHY